MHTKDVDADFGDIVYTDKYGWELTKNPNIGSIPAGLYFGQIKGTTEHQILLFGSA